MIRCAPMPGEFVLGFAGRLRHLNLQPYRRLLHARRVGEYPQLVSTALAMGKSEDAFLSEHTLSPWLACIRLEDEQYVSEYLWRWPKDMSTIKSYTGLWAPKHGQWQCPECVVADTQQYGFSYWHTSHQAPGVTRCELHDRPLVCDESRHRFHAPPEPRLSHLPSHLAIPRAIQERVQSVAMRWLSARKPISTATLAPLLPQRIDDQLKGLQAELGAPQWVQAHIGKHGFPKTMNQVYGGCGPGLNTFGYARRGYQFLIALELLEVDLGQWVGLAA